MATQALGECEWFLVYDIAEAIADHLWQMNGVAHQTFARYLNEFFRKYGIGWQMVDRKIEVRGPIERDQVVRKSIAGLELASRRTASRELHEALHDLSRRPQADVTGAVQHAGAALECVARDVSGDEKKTLATS
jgi:AbiJ-like protein